MQRSTLRYWSRAQKQPAIFASLRAYSVSLSNRNEPLTPDAAARRGMPTSSNSGQNIIPPLPPTQPAAPSSPALARKRMPSASSFGNVDISTAPSSRAEPDTSASPFARRLSQRQRTMDGPDPFQIGSTPARKPQERPKKRPTGQNARVEDISMDMVATGPLVSTPRPRRLPTGGLPRRPSNGYQGANPRARARPQGQTGRAGTGTGMGMGTGTGTGTGMSMRSGFTFGGPRPRLAGRRRDRREQAGPSESDPFWQKEEAEEIALLRNHASISVNTTPNRPILKRMVRRRVSQRAVTESTSGAPSYPTTQAQVQLLDASDPVLLARSKVTQNSTMSPAVKQQLMKVIEKYAQPAQASAK